MRIDFVYDRINAEKKYNLTVIMKKNFIPDYLFASYADVRPDFLCSIGVRALLIDIDNTLAPYEVADADEAHIAWFSSLREAGIRCALISNNHPPRVERFNAKLGLDAYPDSHKPARKALDTAMARLGVDASETAVLGDQIFTDVWAGKRIGLRAILVPPIRDKKTLFFRFKRLLERPFLRAYRKREEKKNG